MVMVTPVLPIHQLQLRTVPLICKFTVHNPNKTARDGVEDEEKQDKAVSLGHKRTNWIFCETENFHQG
jgi:hypothetical protein